MVANIDIMDAVRQYLLFLDDNNGRVTAAVNSDDLQFSVPQKIKEELSLLNDPESNKGITTLHLNIIIRHLKLVQGIFGMNYRYAISLLSNLRNCISVEYHFPEGIETYKKLFALSVELYGQYRCETNLRDLETRYIITSARYLMRIGFSFIVENAKIIINEEMHESIHKYFENMVNTAGAYNILALFIDEIQNKYNTKYKRYMLAKTKNTLEGDQLRLNVPYNYLMQTIMKCLKYNYPVSEGNYEQYYIKLKDDMIKYTSCLDMQDQSSLFDMNFLYEDILEVLTHYILEDCAFNVIQWNPDYAIEVIEGSFNNELTAKFEAINQYSAQQYFLFIRKFLTIRRNYIPIELIYKTVPLTKSTIKLILNDISFSLNEVNKDFNSIFSRPNYGDKPLIRLNGQLFFILSPSINAFSFYEILYQKCKLSYGNKSKFDRLQGEVIEKYIKDRLSSSNYPYASGYYKNKYTNPNAINECDLVLNTARRSAFVEIKKRPLPETTNKVFLVEVLRSLAEGLVTAQRQSTEHAIELNKNGYIVLYESQALQGEYTTICSSTMAPIKMSLTQQEYGFLSHTIFTKRFMEALLISTFETVEPTHSIYLQRLNSEQEKFLRLMPYLLPTEQDNLNHVFHNNCFRTFQQFLYALDYSSDVDSFISNLTKDMSTYIGTSDYYTHLFYMLDLEDKG